MILFIPQKCIENHQKKNAFNFKIKELPDYWNERERKI